MANFEYNEGAGTYSATWNHPGNFVVGLGWSTGSSNRVINFDSICQSDQGFYHAVYGWLKNPLTEYYVVENYGYDPGSVSGSHTVGSVYSDGSDYKICKHTRSTSRRSRAPKVSASTSPSAQPSAAPALPCLPITFNAWKEYGFANGAANPDFNYQVFATEAFSGQGSASNQVGG